MAVIASAVRAGLITAIFGLCVQAQDHTAVANWTNIFCGLPTCHGIDLFPSLFLSQAVCQREHFATPVSSLKSCRSWSAIAPSGVQPFIS